MIENSMKNKKGEIATLLTLGLIILGGVLAIGSSIFLSQQKTISTRAIGVTCGDSSDPESLTLGGGVGIPGKCGINVNLYSQGELQISALSFYCKNDGKWDTLANSKKVCKAVNNFIEEDQPCFQCLSGTDTDQCQNCSGITPSGQQSGDEVTSPRTEGAIGSSPSGKDTRCSAYSAGYNNACCVVDTHTNYCINPNEGNYRYRWYGCTGAVCEATKIITQGGRGHLEVCPPEINSGNTSAENGKCLPDVPGVLPPPEAPDDGIVENPPDPSKYDCQSYGTAINCQKFCKADEGIDHQCLAGKDSTEKKWCCKTKSQTPGGGGITTKQCEYKDLKECDKSGCINCKECADGSYKCEMIKEEVKSEPPAAPAAAGDGEESQTEEGLPAPAETDTKTCIPDKTTITVSDKAVTVEKSSDIFKSISCNHILVASPGSNITVFRECPNFLQGSACVYSCYQNEKNVNCKGTYDLWTTSVRGTSVTVINNTGVELKIRAGTSGNSPIVIPETTVANMKYVQGFVDPCTNFANVLVIYEGEKISGSTNRKITCGTRILINLTE
jgi:hypothetical protein